MRPKRLEFISMSQRHVLMPTYSWRLTGLEKVLDVEDVMVRSHGTKPRKDEKVEMTVVVLVIVGKVVVIHLAILPVGRIRSMVEDDVVMVLGLLIVVVVVDVGEIVPRLLVNIVQTNHVLILTRSNEGTKIHRNREKVLSDLTRERADMIQTALG